MRDTAATPGPQGMVTRGTTNPNRLRRIDRWLAWASAPALRRADDPLVVDLGFGASPVTTVELAERMRAIRPDVEVVGLEIDPQRVAHAVRQGHSVRFALGGFELGPLAGRRPVVVRAANVLRQYDVAQVADAWRSVRTALADDGMLVDATCDEIGRLAAWLRVGRDGPVSLTISLRLAGLEHPSAVAARLPKALIHRNVKGEAIHALLHDTDDAWRRHRALASFGARQRWLATCRSVSQMGWPLLSGPARWRLGELEVGADAVC